MRAERLVSMANDIGAFFNGEPDKTEAARGVASHVRRFWDPRMRKEIVAHLKNGGAGLEEPARSGIQMLAHEDPVVQGP
jgi:formate dehydrogenase subunit delta